MKREPLFSEVLRPRQLTDLALPQKDIDHLTQMVASGSIMNLLFHGKCGTGKTSTARVICSIFSPRSYTEMDGASLKKPECVREKIEEHANCGTLCGEGRIFFLDQADLASKSAQNSLLKLVENLSSITRYIFTANDGSKLIPGLRSRLMTFCFDVPAADQADVQTRLLERYQRVFGEIGIPYDQDRVQEIVKTYYPDLRTIANHLDLEFAVPARARQPDLLNKYALAEGQQAKLFSIVRS